MYPTRFKDKVVMAAVRIRAAVVFIAFVEMAIGSITIGGLSLAVVFLPSQKPFNVFVFVLGSAITSALLGLGLLTYSNLVRRLLIFFSGYVILTKILVFAGILHFTGELVTFVSSPVKNAVSILYHTFVILTLNSGLVKKLFSH